MTHTLAASIHHKIRGARQATLMGRTVAVRGSAPLLTPGAIRLPTTRVGAVPAAGSGVVLVAAPAEAPVARRATPHAGGGLTSRQTRIGKLGRL